MATFRVGQRVRVVGATYHPANSGQPVTIVGAGPDCEWIIEFDDGRRPPPDQPQQWGAMSYQLEPLTDPGHTAISIESLLSVPGLESLEFIFQGVKDKA